MPSPTEICNLALWRAGTGKTISAVESEQSTQAGYLRGILAMAVPEVLRAHPWRFARRRVVLSDTGAAPSTWAFAYAYPNDCVQLLTLVLPGVRWPRWDLRPPFEVASSGKAQVIYTDLDQAEAVYTALVDPSHWDASAASCLAWKIAAEVSRPLAGKPDAGNTLEKAYANALSHAAARDLQEAQEGPEPASEFLTVRGCSDPSRRTGGWW